MVFLKSKPNVTDAEKARIEFHLQQIADCVGFNALQLEVVDPMALLDSQPNINDLAKYVAAHLSHDVSELRISTVPQEIQKCGGGG